MSADFVDLSGLIRTPDTLYLYNPAPVELQEDVGGNTIRLCPEHDPGNCPKRRASRKCVAPGVTAVHAMAWYEGKGMTDQKGRPTERQIKAGGAAQYSAAQVAAQLLGEDGRSGSLGKAGVRPLTGDPLKDDVIKAEARSVWRKKRFFDAQTKVRDHEARVAQSKTDPKLGRPEFTEDIQKAYDVLKEAEAEGVDIRTRSHFCRECEKAFYSSEERGEHERITHGVMPQAPASGIDASIIEVLKAQQEAMAAQMAQQGALMASMAAMLAAKPKRGRPPKVKKEEEAV